MAKRRKAGITKVPDRAPGVPLGRETLAAVIVCGRKGRSPAVCQRSMTLEGGRGVATSAVTACAKGPAWKLDLAVTVLE